MKVYDAYISDAVEILQNLFVDSAELAAYLTPLVFLKYLSILREQDSEIVKLPNTSLETLTLNLGKQFDLFSNVRKFSVSDIGAEINFSLIGIEHSNPSDMGKIFSGIDYCHPRLGIEPARSNVLRTVINCVQNIDNNILKEAALSGVSLTDLFFYSSSGSRFFVEFTTPHDVAELLTSIVKPKDNDSVYDGACGSGQLLLSFLRDPSKKGVRYIRAYGSEKNYLSWMVARLNFLFCGFHSADIILEDSIGKFSNQSQHISQEYYDVILSNPPKSQKEWGYSAETSRSFEELGFGIPSKSNGDFAFVLSMLSHLNPENGRMAIIVPDGALFRQGPEYLIRKNLTAFDKISAIISLPQRILYNYPLGTSILVLRSGKSDNSIHMIDARNHGRVGKFRNELPKESIELIKSALDRDDEIDNFSRVVSFEEIQHHDFTLLPQHYIGSEEITEKDDLSLLLLKRRRLQDSLEEINHELDFLMAAALESTSKII